MNISPANAVVLDSLTLQGAVRLLDAADGTPHYHETGVQRRCNDKWNYPLNTGFRIASDVSCLAQLVQAIIMHEEVMIETSYMERRNSRKYSGDPLDFRQLQVTQLPNGPVSAFRLPLSTRIKHAENACNRVLEYANSDAFKDYLKLLSTDSLEGAFIHISHGYFETGYSDAALFPPDEMSAVPATGARAFAEYGKLLKETRHSIVDHVLYRTPHSRQDVDDKAAAAVDVLRSAHAAFFYQSIADSRFVGYLSHPLRSSIVAFDVMAAEHGLAFVGTYVLNLLRESRAKATIPINDLLGRELIHVEIPFFLAAVLKEARTPADVIDRAMAIRDSADARRMRSWMRQFEEMTASNEITLDRLDSEMTRLKIVVDKWTSRSDSAASSGEPFNIGLNFGLVSVARNMKFPRVQRKPKYLRLLQTLADVSNTTPRFDALLRKVFGKNVGDPWEHYRHALSKFQEVDLHAQAERHSPLSLIIDRDEYEILKASQNKWDRLRAELAWLQVVRKSGPQTADEYIRIMTMLSRSSQQSRPIHAQTESVRDSGTMIRMACGHVLLVTNPRAVRWLSAEADLSYRCTECGVDRVIVAVGKDALPRTDH